MSNKFSCKTQQQFWTQPFNLFNILIGDNSSFLTFFQRFISVKARIKMKYEFMLKKVEKNWYHSQYIEKFA